jgi:ABC-type amino acid transport substrate-binding protein
MVNLLRTRQVDALVLDAPVLEHIVATNDNCDLFVTGRTFMSFGISLAFPAAFDPEVVQGFSEAIVLAQVGSCVSW